MTKGIEEFGAGKWKEIWETFISDFHAKRRPSDLKDRWRVLQRETLKEVEKHRGTKKK